METVWSEARFALRSLARRPLAAAAIVITLGLGIGATTAIYSVIQGVLLDPLPYPESDRLALVLESNLDAGFPVFTVSAPPEASTRPTARR